MNTSASNKSFLSSLLSPAFGLAILGTGAFIFSFYRAGQLASLVLPKDYVMTHAPNGKSKLDVNSRALLVAMDSSMPARIALTGDRRRAIAEALRNLTDNSPTDVANIALAGDIYSSLGNNEEKELGLGLLASAIAMAPKNQYLASRYVNRLAASMDLEESALQLTEFARHYPKLRGVHLVLAKIYTLQDEPKQSLDELDKVKDGEQLSAREQAEAGLMFVKLGRTYDGYKLFRMAISGTPSQRFYVHYCGDLVGNTVDDYKTALAIVQANLNNNPSADQLGLQIKEAVLMLCLNRSKEAREILERALAKHKDNWDLQILVSAADFADGDSDKALSYLEQAAKNYRPKI